MQWVYFLSIILILKRLAIKETQIFAVIPSLHMLCTAVLPDKMSYWIMISEHPQWRPLFQSFLKKDILCYTCLCAICNNNKKIPFSQQSHWNFSCTNFTIQWYLWMIFKDSIQYKYLKTSTPEINYIFYLSDFSIWWSQFSHCGFADFSCTMCGRSCFWKSRLFHTSLLHWWWDWKWNKRIRTDSLERLTGPHFGWKSEDRQR